MELLIALLLLAIIGVLAQAAGTDSRDADTRYNQPDLVARDATADRTLAPAGPARRGANPLRSARIAAIGRPGGLVVTRRPRPADRRSRHATASLAEPRARETGNAPGAVRLPGACL